MAHLAAATMSEEAFQALGTLGSDPNPFLLCPKFFRDLLSLPHVIQQAWVIDFLKELKALI